jgi:hypothetical protein
MYKDTHNDEIGNNLRKFFERVGNTVESKLDFNNRFQIYNGNLEKDDNFLEKVNDEIAVDVLGTSVNVNSLN